MNVSDKVADPVALKSDFAEVNHVRLHYVSAGDSKRKLLLFLHGFPEFWYAWRRQLAEFGRDYFAVAVDMRGYNLSSKPEKVEDYEMKRLVEDVRQLAEKLTKHPFVLVGHDWGGVVAWALAMQHPDLLEKLVIINAPHPAVFTRELQENAGQQKASQYMLLLRSPQAEAALSACNFAALANIVLSDLVKRGLATEDDKKAYRDAWSQPGALTGGLNYYRAARVGPPTAMDASTGNFGIDAEAMTVKVATLVLWGEKDTALLTGNLNGLDSFVPNLTLKRVPDATHWIVHEKTSLVNDALRSFLEGRK